MLPRRDDFLEERGQDDVAELESLLAGDRREELRKKAHVREIERAIKSKR